jgi:hypothetical protein
MYFGACLQQHSTQSRRLESWLRCWLATRKDLHEQCRSLACHEKSSLDGTSR